MATSLASSVPLTLHNGASTNGVLGCNGTSTATSASDFEHALDDALRHLRTLLKAVQLHASSAEAHAADAALRSKVAEASALASDLSACLERVAKPSPSLNCSTSSSSAFASVVRKKKFDALEPSPHEHESWATSSTAPPTHSSQPSVWSGFYNKTLRERFDVLSLMYPRLGRAVKQTDDHHAPARDAVVDPVAKLGDLPLRTANLMIENCIGVIGIPLGYVLRAS